MRKLTERPYSVDKLMLNMASALVSDFRQVDSVRTTVDTFRGLLSPERIKEVRAFNFGKEASLSAYEFKIRYQMESLFKRHRFDNDLFSEQDLLEKSVLQYQTNQDRLTTLNQTRDELPMYIWNVLSQARRYCKKVLGRFDKEKHKALCRFGSRATVGVPLRLACEAERYRVPISGSSDHISWFVDEILSADPSVSDYIYSQVGDREIPFQLVDTLTLTLVPKTFKSLRSIMPNTTLGSFYSAGLGDMISDRLKRAGYDITTLQVEHGVLACGSSISGKLVTMDQSLASDNITAWLVEQLLPYDWFEALSLGRVGKVRLPDGRVTLLESFCTMGIGFTFPLQTLIFLSLLKGISSQYAPRCKISAYGDDLIYDKRIHPFVDTIFTRLGLIINRDKTFVDGPFRESCGSDFYAGVDVRPFQPQNERSSCTRREYEATCYKYINGLLRRWHACELEQTLALLVDELSRCSRGILRVPPDFPDTAGVRVSAMVDFGFLPEVCCAPLKRLRHGRISFFYLRAVARKKEEVRHAPYLWAALQGLPDRFDHGSNHRTPMAHATARSVEQWAGVRTSSQVFSVMKVDSVLKGSKRPAQRVSTFIDSKGQDVKIQRQNGVSSHWSP
jgi:hypothetical protein